MALAAAEVDADVWTVGLDPRLGISVAEADRMPVRLLQQAVVMRRIFRARRRKQMLEEALDRALGGSDGRR